VTCSKSEAALQVPGRAPRQAETSAPSDRYCIRFARSGPAGLEGAPGAGTGGRGSRRSAGGGADCSGKRFSSRLPHWRRFAEGDRDPGSFASWLWILDGNVPDHRSPSIPLRGFPAGRPPASPKRRSSWRAPANVTSGPRVGEDPGSRPGVRAFLAYGQFDISHSSPPGGVGRQPPSVVRSSRLTSIRPSRRNYKRGGAGGVPSSLLRGRRGGTPAPRTNFNGFFFATR